MGKRSHYLLPIKIRKKVNSVLFCTCVYMISKSIVHLDSDNLFHMLRYCDQDTSRCQDEIIWHSTLQKPQTCNNCKNVCNIQQKDVIHRKHVIYRGKREDYMFSEHVIFIPDKLHLNIGRLHMESGNYMYQILNVFNNSNM